MSNENHGKAAFRIRDHYARGEKPKKYARSWAVLDADEETKIVETDIIGNIALKRQVLTDSDGGRWTLQPNRKIMPSQWDLRQESGAGHWQFRQRALGMIINPFHQTLMSVTDVPSGRELLFVDLHGAKLPVVLGLEWGKYALVDGETPIATLSRLQRKDPPEGKGILGKVRRFMHGSDQALVSTSDTMPLPAPAALTLFLLYREFTDTSAG